MDNLHGARVYVRVDRLGRIVQIEGEYSLANLDLDAPDVRQIDEGAPCNRLNRAQVEYLDGGLYTMDGIPRYKLTPDDSAPFGVRPVLRSDTEIEADRAAIPPPPPTAQEDADSLLIDIEYRLTLLELGI